MTEELITFKTALLAKEIGFDIPVKYGVFGKKMKLTEDYGNHHHQIPILRNWNKIEAESFSIPTQSFLQRWLREVHTLDVFVDLDINKDYFVCVKDKTKDNFSGLVYESEDTFKTYEEALEAGLQEGLKLIKS